MPLNINLHHLFSDELEVTGELSVAELDIDTQDEVIQVNEPLKYDLKIEKMDEGLLVQGELSIPLQCKCVRCLESFNYTLEMKNWSCHVPLTGEEAVPVVNDCVDLTPFVREDILLSFPQHPLCDPQCEGLLKTQTGKGKKSRGTGSTQPNLSAWAELNKLKF